MNSFLYKLSESSDINKARIALSFSSSSSEMKIKHQIKNQRRKNQMAKILISI